MSEEFLFVGTLIVVGIWVVFAIATMLKDDMEGY